MFNPKYIISNQMVSRLSEIAGINTLVERLRLLPEREVFLRRAAAVKMAHTSTSIEGNRLQEYQVAQVAQGKHIKAEERQIKEVKNYLSALRIIDQISGSKKNLTTLDILAVHQTVMNGLEDPQKTGAWRPGPVYVINVLPNRREVIAYTPPKAVEVPKLINELLDWLNTNSDVHPIIRAGIFHYQFETIHPFTDGNGRTGRLLTLLYLYQSDWDFKKILVLEDYYNQNRKAYYEALQTGKTYRSRQTVDLSNWLNYYINGFLDEAKKVKDQVLSLSTLKTSSAAKITLDRDELKIVDFVVTLGRITSSDVVDILTVPKRTAQAKLKKLEEIKVLKKEGAGPATHYVIPTIKV